jgi:hypothetical protein
LGGDVANDVVHTVIDDVPEFAAGLRARGLTVDAVGAELHVDVTDENVYDVVRDGAAQLEAPLSRMEITRHKLEELFREPAGAARV